MTAVYRGTPKNGSPILLRSYDSRKEPAPEFNCTIWQAGRATSATGLAFKPIQIGQSVFIDEGAGKYNPAPQIMDEAVCNEYPGREVGVFISIGTGKRPPGTGSQQHLWWEGFVSGGMGDFAEARRRLIAKIEGCEETHQYMLREHLSKRGVNPENYYRLNVEVGVGEFGMNEWNRLAEISTNTRMYLSKNSVQSMNMDAAAKIARIHRAKVRWERQMSGRQVDGMDRPLPKPPLPPLNPMAAELPGEDVPQPLSPHRRPDSQLLSPHPYHLRPNSSDSDKQVIISSDEFPQPVERNGSPRVSGEIIDYRRPSHERYGSDPHSSNSSIPVSPRRSGEYYGQEDQMAMPPPRPPKSPLRYPDGPPPLPGMMNRPPAGVILPYPDTDGPPPVVNMARKPNIAS